MSADEYTPTILHADPEHGGLRFVVIIVLIVNLFVGFLLIQLFLSLFASDTILIEFATVLSCTLAIPLALGLSWVVENILKREWHSGKSITLDDNTLVFQYPREDDEESEVKVSQKTFDLSKRVVALYWYFSLKGYPRAGRERRVSNKWFGVACQLQQDETRFIAFCYMPPQSIEKWVNKKNSSEPFVKISLAEVYEQAGQKRRSSASNRPSIDASLLTSSEGRYWLAEQRRWKIGAELSESDFEILTNYIERRSQSS